MRIDGKFLDDLRKICDQRFPSNEEAREQCKGTTGAWLYYEAVSLIGWWSFDCNLKDDFLTRQPPWSCTRYYN